MDTKEIQQENQTPIKEKKNNRKDDPTRLYSINEVELRKFFNDIRDKKAGALQGLIQYFFYQYVAKGYGDNIDLINATDQFVKWKIKGVGLGRDPNTISKTREYLEKRGFITAKLTPWKRADKGRFKGKERTIKIHHMINAINKKDISKNQEKENLLLEKYTSLMERKGNLKKQEEIDVNLQTLKVIYNIDLEEINRINGLYLNNYSRSSKPLKLTTIIDLCNYINILSSRLKIDPVYNYKTILKIFDMLYNRHIRTYITYTLDPNHIAEIDYIEGLLSDNWITKENYNYTNFSELIDIIDNTDLDFSEEYFYKWNKEKSNYSVLLTKSQENKLKQQFWDKAFWDGVKYLSKCLLIEYKEYEEERITDNDNLPSDNFFCIVDRDDENFIMKYTKARSRYLSKVYHYWLLQYILKYEVYKKQKPWNYKYIIEEWEKHPNWKNFRLDEINDRFDMYKNYWNKYDV